MNMRAFPGRAGKARSKAETRLIVIYWFSMLRTRHWATKETKPNQTKQNKIKPNQINKTNHPTNQTNNNKTDKQTNKKSYNTLPHINKR